jgi:hypothetical protein
VPDEVNACIKQWLICSMSRVMNVALALLCWSQRYFVFTRELGRRTAASDERLSTVTNDLRALRI